MEILKKNLSNKGEFRKTRLTVTSPIRQWSNLGIVWPILVQWDIHDLQVIFRAVLRFTKIWAVKGKLYLPA